MLTGRAARATKHREREETTMSAATARGLRGAAATAAAIAIAVASWPLPGRATPPNPEAVDGPLANRVWAGCTLTSTNVHSIRSRLNLGAGIDTSQTDVSFIVVYTFKNPNNGQKLTAGGETGPVVCIAPNVRIEKTREAEDIPTAEDQGASVLNVDLLDLSEALLIRYGYTLGTNNIKENRFCHTVANPATGTPGNPPPETNTDCFRVYPKP
jgi:hypothetical protein